MIAHKIARGVMYYERLVFIRAIEPYRRNQGGRHRRQQRPYEAARSPRQRLEAFAQP